MRCAYPDDINLVEIGWNPTREEKLLECLRVLQAQWDSDDAERLGRRSAELAASLAADNERFAARFAADEEIERRTRWWLEQQEKEKNLMTKLLENFQNELDAPAQKAHRELLAKAERLGREINWDRLREEKNELIRRGVCRGR